MVSMQARRAAASSITRQRAVSSTVVQAPSSAMIGRHSFRMRLSCERKSEIGINVELQVALALD
jgi:hypothetical protein